MKRILLLSFLSAVTATAIGQDLSADKLMDMLSLPVPKMESFLTKKNYKFSETESLGDTAVSVYQYLPSAGKKKQPDPVSRKLLRSVLKETFVITYQTTSVAEYSGIIEVLKKKGFYCDYEKDKTVSPASYLYQHEDYTAEASIITVAGAPWYSITFYKKLFSAYKDLHFAEDLLQFTSHEYLAYYFGNDNVKKDIYYFNGEDVAKCSVLFINSNRQVIFIWNDKLNNRKIENLIFGGQHKLKSQDVNAKFIADNNWWLKCGIRAGMALPDLRTLNQKNIVFCGGKAPNPGLIFPESTGKIDFKNKDVILGCMNCSDKKFLDAKKMYADKAMEDGRNLFVLTIVLYPADDKIFN